MGSGMTLRTEIEYAMPIATGSLHMFTASIGISHLLDPLVLAGHLVVSTGIRYEQGEKLIDLGSYGLAASITEALNDTVALQFGATAVLELPVIMEGDVWGPQDMSLGQGVSGSAILSFGEFDLDMGVQLVRYDGTIDWTTFAYVTYYVRQ